MCLNFKIEAKGFCSGFNMECDSTLSVNVDVDDFKKVLGEALYEVEKQGFGFVTSEIYEDISKGYDDLSSLRKQYQKIYTSEVVSVSVKLA